MPVSASSEPAWAAKANGSSSCEVGLPSRIAATTTIGSSAATAPLIEISAVSSAHMIITAGTRRPPPRPARAISHWPAQVVTPVASSPSLTTNSAAMKITIGSPKPASVCCRSITPEANSASAAPTATNSTESRFQTNRTTTAPRTAKLIVASSTQRTAPSRRRISTSATVAFSNSSSRTRSSGAWMLL